LLADFANLRGFPCREDSLHAALIPFLHYLH
jgi:hypothetical protein